LDAFAAAASVVAAWRQCSASACHEQLFLDNCSAYELHSLEWEGVRISPPVGLVGRLTRSHGLSAAGDGGGMPALHSTSMLLWRFLWRLLAGVLVIGSTFALGIAVLAAMPSPAVRRQRWRLRSG